MDPATNADLRVSLYADRVTFLRREIAQTILERFMAEDAAERTRAAAYEKRLRIMVRGAEDAYEKARKGSGASPRVRPLFL